jgi:hypothetical protein
MNTFISLSPWERAGGEGLHLPLPLGEGRGEGLTRHQTLPLFPLPSGEGMKVST